MEEVPKKWGYEEIICNTDKYCGKFLHLNKGHCCSIHYHKEKDEVFHIVEGVVKMELFGETKIMNVDDTIRIKPYMLHRFYGMENAVILEVSTPHKDSDSYRIIKSDNCDKGRT